MRAELDAVLTAHNDWLWGRVGACGADLRGAVIPVVVNIDATILAAIEAEPAAFDMGTWHGKNDACGTTHCRAGWAITLAGDAGKALEASYGPAAAGPLIYAASRPGKPVPDFYASTDVARASIEADAAEASA